MKLGTHVLSQEKVAVKILEKSKIVEVADVNRVTREIQILKRVRHQNVIQLCVGRAVGTRNGRRRAPPRARTSHASFGALIASRGPCVSSQAQRTRVADQARVASVEPGPHLATASAVARGACARAGASPSVHHVTLLHRMG